MACRLGIECSTLSAMNTVAFDTLAFAKRLQEAGVPAVQAEAHAIAQADFLTHHLLSEVATKIDLKALEVATKTDLKALEVATKTDLKALEVATKTDLKALKADIKALEIATKADITALKDATRADLADMRVALAGMETKLSLRMLFMVGALATLMTFFKFMG